MEQCWLYSLTAAGRKDLRYLSFTHLGCISLSLKELPSAVKVSCRGWNFCTSSDVSLSIILLSPTTCTGSRGDPRMELAFFISLSSLFLSAAQTLLLQKTTLQQMADATTESQKEVRSGPCTPKYLSFLSRYSLL